MIPCTHRKVPLEGWIHLPGTSPKHGQDTSPTAAKRWVGRSTNPSWN